MRTASFSAFGRLAVLRAAVTAGLMLFIDGRIAKAQRVLENDQMRLELIGLKRWTISMIQDSLSRHAPNDSLLSHACAAILREKLKFADASVTYYTTTSSGQAMKPYAAVTVIEPQDSALVRYRDVFQDSLPTRHEWKAVIAIFEDHNIAFQSAIQRAAFLLSDNPIAIDDSTIGPALPLRPFLRANRTAKSHRLAIATLSTDGNWRNRVAAAVLLANFGSDDSAWLALMEGLRDPEAAVRSTAVQVISALRSGAPRRVNWARERQTLRALLGGTNLFAHNEVMEVLAATQVDPALARSLLADNGHIVLAKLGSQGVSERQAARRFLVQAAGRDLGPDPAAWLELLRGL